MDSLSRSNGARHLLLRCCGCCSSRTAAAARHLARAAAGRGTWRALLQGPEALARAAAAAQRRSRALLQQPRGARF